METGGRWYTEIRKKKPLVKYITRNVSLILTNDTIYLKTKSCVLRCSSWSSDLNGSEWWIITKVIRRQIRSYREMVLETTSEDIWDNVDSLLIKDKSKRTLIETIIKII